jgi:hypothetical protein
VTKNYYETNSKWASSQFRLCKLSNETCASLSLSTMSRSLSLSTMYTYTHFAYDLLEYTRIVTIPHAT